MRIAFVTETWHPGIDGVVVRLDATVRHLVARGHQVLVLAPTLGEPVPGVQQVKLRSMVIPVIDRRRPWGLPDRRVPALLEAFGPDIVHVVNPVLQGVAAVRDIGWRWPLAISFHTDIAAYTERYRLGFLRRFAERRTQATYLAAPLRLATSPTGVRRLAEVGVPHAVIWPPAVSDVLQDITPVEREPGEPPVVLTVGRLAPEKGLDRLAPVLRAAASTPERWRLRLVGDGPDRARLERLFAGTDTSFAGFRSGADLAQEYARASVVAFTSTTETVGLVLLEAAATGLPVVAVNNQATRDTLAGYPRAVLVGEDAGAEQWLAAFGEALATPPVEPGARRPGTWADATDVLLEAYQTTLDRPQDK